MRGFTAIVFISVLFFSCNSSKFIVKNFEEKTAHHQKIALLPFSVTHKGRVPAQLSQQELQQINRSEGVAFQQGVHQALTEQKTEASTSPRLLVQLTSKQTQAESFTASKLCKELGVDALIVTQIEKEKLLPHLNTFGVEVLVEILNKLSADSTGLNSNLPQIPGNAARTFELKIESKLYDKNNELLWKDIWYTEILWSSTEKEIIEQVAARYKKKFPYAKRLVTNN